MYSTYFSQVFATWVTCPSGIAPACQGQRWEVSLAGRQSSWSPQQHRVPLPRRPGQGAGLDRQTQSYRGGGRLPPQMPTCEDRAALPCAHQVSGLGV